MSVRCCLFSLCFLLSPVLNAAEPLKVVVNIYNLTGVPHEILGHQSNHYQSTANIDVSHNAQEKMSHHPNKPSQIRIQPREKGHMYRLRYRVKSEQTACTLDFVLRWLSKEQRYELDNITSHAKAGSACPLSPVKQDAIDNRAVFSMAVINYPLNKSVAQMPPPPLTVDKH